MLAAGSATVKACGVSANPQAAEPHYTEKADVVLPRRGDFGGSEELPEIKVVGFTDRT